MCFHTFVCKCMFQPVDVVALLVVEAKMRAATFSARQGAVDRRLCTVEQEAEFNGFDQFRIELLAFVL